jgi:hypothetical protein
MPFKFSTIMTPITLRTQRYQPHYHPTSTHPAMLIQLPPTAHWLVFFFSFFFLPHLTQNISNLGQYPTKSPGISTKMLPTSHRFQRYQPHHHPTSTHPTATHRALPSTAHWLFFFLKKTQLTKSIQTRPIPHQFHSNQHQNDPHHLTNPTVPTPPPSNHTPSRNDSPTATHRALALAPPSSSASAHAVWPSPHDRCSGVREEVVWASRWAPRETAGVWGFWGGINDKNERKMSENERKMSKNG